MTDMEFAMFSMALQTYYPRENLLPNEQSLELWFKQLQDIPYKVAEVALQRWVSCNKWSPTIADLREIAHTVTEGELPDWGEGWLEVQKAIRYFGSYREDEALDSLSPLTRKVTERIGFRNLCMSESPEASRANFRMIYESLAEREKKDAQIPDTLKIVIQDKMIEEGKHDKTGND